jgi:hypothetical protein
MQDTLRSKWAAVGAAIAVTLGAGGVSLTQAAITSGEKPVFVALPAPCRLADTRPDSTVGPKSTVLAAGESNAYEIQVTGGSGNCTGALAVPDDATGVALNVTAIARTAPVTGRSYFTVYPADAARPHTSNLNFLAADPPVPNKVDVGLSADGRIRIFNNEGQADVAVDVFGYYIDHAHTGADIVDASLTGADIEDGSLTGDDVADGSLTGADIEDGSLTGDDVAAGTLSGDDLEADSVTSAETADEPGIVSAFRSAPFVPSADPTAVVTTAIRVPADGWLEVHVSGNWRGDTTEPDVVQCQVQLSTEAPVDATAPNVTLDDRDGNAVGMTGFATHRVLPIAVADNPGTATLGQTLALVCVEGTGVVTLTDVHISATYYPTSYAPAT